MPVRKLRANVLPFWRFNKKSTKKSIKISTQAKRHNAFFGLKTDFDKQTIHLGIINTDIHIKSHLDNFFIARSLYMSLYWFRGFSLFSL